MLSAPPAAEIAPENAPAVRKTRHMVRIFSSATPLAITFSFVRTQGCEMKDKFRMNFFIVLPAAVITFILLVTISLTDSFIQILCIF